MSKTLSDRLTSPTPDVSLVHSLMALYPLRSRVPLLLWRIDYTHVINIGGNDLEGLRSAAGRYEAGGAGYVDPVAFENVFEDIEGVPTLTFAPLLRVSGLITGPVLRKRGEGHDREVLLGRF